MTETELLTPDQSSPPPSPEIEELSGLSSHLVAKDEALRGTGAYGDRGRHYDGQALLAYVPPDEAPGVTLSAGSIGGSERLKVSVHFSWNKQRVGGRDIADASVRFEVLPDGDTVETRIKGAADTFRELAAKTVDVASKQIDEVASDMGVSPDNPEQPTRATVAKALSDLRQVAASRGYVPEGVRGVGRLLAVSDYLLAAAEQSELSPEAYDSTAMVTATNNLYTALEPDLQPV